MCGEGLVVKSKKRKIESGKSGHVDDDSPRTLVVGPFESLASELRVVKELVAKPPQGPSESSTGTRYYVPQIEFDAYLIDQRKQKAQLANFEKAYVSLSLSHDEDGYEPVIWSDDGGDKDSEATETNGED
ncbi:hypothetical protein KY289_001201 [Solanum tuberosum]|nr:hypothetical protein KY289_001201 [Solanum tuberosum]